MELTNFEKLKNLSMEEMAEFLSDQMALEGTVYDQWMTDTFCNNCPDTEDQTIPQVGYQQERPDVFQSVDGAPFSYQ